MAKAVQKSASTAQTESISMLDAKRDFLSICRRVATEGERVYVYEKMKQNVMTITSSKGNMNEPLIAISPVGFRNLFARHMALVRLGFCFQIESPKGHVYVRRHTGYIDPVKKLVDLRARALTESTLERLKAEKAVRVLDEDRLAEILAAALQSMMNCGEGAGRLAALERDGEHGPERRGEPRIVSHRK